MTEGGALNGLPNCEWFFGANLVSAAYIIAVFGILHLFPYLYAFSRNMSPLVIVPFILALIWFGFSIALFIGITKKLHITFEMFVWYTMIFAILMFILMIVLMSTTTDPFCDGDVGVERTWLNITSLVVALLFYCLVMYMAFVVNTCRKKYYAKKTN